VNCENGQHRQRQQHDQDDMNQQGIELLATLQANVEIGIEPA
jgi:hypothetical protein